MPKRQPLGITLDTSFALVSAYEKYAAEEG